MSFKKYLTARNILIAILFVSAILRFWGLGSQDILQDEGFYSFRSMGYLDFINNDDQTTPIQWFKNTSLPFWTKLSFHDHPPLFFLVQNIFFKFFGDSILAARLPSFFFGVFSIWIIYLLAKKIFKNEWAGLLTALLSGLSNINIWISRSSIMEGMLIFLIPLNIYLFFLFIENRKRWFWFGATLGFCFLTKYTSFFLIPVYFIYLFIYRRDYFKKSEFFLATGLALGIFLPVIVYNIFLYKTTGHFDLQFAYLFHQKTPEWRASIGKIQDPFSQIIHNLMEMYSLPTLFLSLAGILYSVFLWKKEKNHYIVFGWLNLIFITLILAAVGSAYRFIAFYAAPSVFFIVLFFSYLNQELENRIILKILLASFLVYEAVFAISSIFLFFPDYGVIQLDQYLTAEIGSSGSLATPKSPNPHLEKIIQAHANSALAQKRKITLIYDENISLSQKLWLFERRVYYQAMPSLTVAEFKFLLKSRRAEELSGYEFYFIRASEFGPLNQYFSTNDAAQFENFLKNEMKISPIKTIYGYGDLPMFYIYKFSI